MTATDVATVVSHHAPFGRLRDINSPIPLNVVRYDDNSYLITAVNGEALILPERPVMFLQDIGNCSIIVEASIEGPGIFPVRIDLYFGNDDEAIKSVVPAASDGGIFVILVTEMAIIRFEPPTNGACHV